MTNALKVALLCCLSTLPMMAADVTGKWTYQSSGGVQVWGKTAPDSTHPAETVVITLKADGNVLAGAVTFPRTGARNVPNTKRISSGTIDGDNLSFDTVDVVLGTQMKTHYVGKVDGDTIHFVVKSGGGSSHGTAFDARRSAD
jgi:hypothetical protein